MGEPEKSRSIIILFLPKMTAPLAQKKTFTGISPKTYRPLPPPFPLPNDMLTSPEIRQHFIPLESFLPFLVFL